MIEHFGGNFPLWLAPVQVAILPVSEKIIDYSTFIYNELKELGVRTIINDKSEKIGSKIRQAEIEKVNIMLILGEKEAKSSLVSIRRRFEGNTGTIGIDELKLALVNEIKKLGVYPIRERNRNNDLMKILLQKRLD